MVAVLVAVFLPVAAGLGVACEERTPRKLTDAPQAPPFRYLPEGCGYVVTPNEAFIEYAQDDPRDPGDIPLRPRVGLGGGTERGVRGYADPRTSAVILWETKAKTRATKIEFGEAPDALTRTLTGHAWTTPSPKGLGANEPETYMHEVHLCGLAPGRKWFYRVGGGPDGFEKWSPVSSFFTVPDGKTMTVGVSGDARDHVEIWQLVQQRMREAKPAFQLFSGDLVSIGAYSSLWNTWLDAAEPTLSQQMILFAAGNHENLHARYFANVALPGDGLYQESFASFDAGSAHFVVIDDQPIATDLGSDRARAIRAFLDKDLAKVARTETPFVVVVHHRGLYSTSSHAGDSDLAQARSVLAPVYRRFGVDLVITGHDHEYERTVPIRPGDDPAGLPVADPEGTTYVICAGAGAPPYGYGSGVVPYRAAAAGFDAPTGRVGVYCMLSLEEKKMSLTAYGLKATAGGIAGDDLLDRWETTRIR